MITYLLGIPGSGKSYYAVYNIYYNFAKDLKKTKNTFKKDYKSCYTNVNGLNFKLLNDVYSLNWDIFDNQIKELHQLYKQRDKILKDSEFDTIDDILIDKANEYNIYKTLFVIDECHNFFDLQKPHLVWWLTYHRHLHHDIFLITQNLSLVNSKYKSLAERFYKAKPASLSLFSKFFYYNYFTESRCSQASKVETIKIQKDDKVFQLYQSGDSVKTKNVILKFLSIALVLFVLLLILGYWYYSSKFKQDASPAPTTKEHLENNTQSKQLTIDEDEEEPEQKSLEDIHNPKLFPMLCSSKYECSSKLFDFNMDKEFIFNLLDYYDYKVLSVKKVYDDFYKYILVVDASFLEVLATYQREEKSDSNEPKSTAIASNNNLFGGFKK